MLNSLLQAVCPDCTEPITVTVLCKLLLSMSHQVGTETQREGGHAVERGSPSRRVQLWAAWYALDVIINLHHESEVQNGQAAVGCADQVARVRVRHQPACTQQTCLSGGCRADHINGFETAAWKPCLSHLCEPLCTLWVTQAEEHCRACLSTVPLLPL